MKSKAKTPVLDAVAKAQHAKECISETLKELLTVRGWKYTSDTPGCCWLYERKLPDGRILLCDQELALQIEQGLCGEEYPEMD